MDLIEQTTRQRFEEDCKDIRQLASMSFTKNKLGKYTSQETEKVWQGYSLYHQMLTKRAHIPEGVDFAGQPYVVMRLNDEGRPVAARRPMQHNVRVRAQAEATRLSDSYGGAFAIWRLSEIIQTKPVTPEEPTETE